MGMRFLGSDKISSYVLDLNNCFFSSMWGLL